MVRVTVLGQHLRHGKQRHQVDTFPDGRVTAPNSGHFRCRLTLRLRIASTSGTCGGAARPGAMPRHADRIQFYLCGAALGGGSYARASHVDSTNRKILKNTTKSCVGFYPGIPSRSACAS